MSQEAALVSTDFFITAAPVLIENVSRNYKHNLRLAATSARLGVIVAYSEHLAQGHWPLD